MVLGTSLLPGKMVQFGTSLLPGKMVQFFNSHQSFPEFLPKSMVSLEIHVWGYVKKATQKQCFATCVDIDFVPVFLNFGQLLFSIK